MQPHGLVCQVHLSGTIVNNTTINIHVPVYMGIYSFLLDVWLRSGISESCGSSVSPLETLLDYFPKCCTILYTHHSVWSFQFFCIHTNTYYPSLITAILVCVKSCLIVVMIYIFLMANDVTIFWCAPWPFIYLIWRNSCSKPLSILTELCIFSES